MATTNVDSKVKNPDYASPNFDGDFRLLELSLHSPNNVDVVQLNSSSVLQQIEIFEGRGVLRDEFLRLSELFK